MYSVSYGRSKALVIGIDKYVHASPLRYAVNDAVAIAKILTENLGFATEDVKVLTDENATRNSIFQAFLALATNGTDVDDRLVVFFAGHGHTISSIRGEVGYLVPSDGLSSDLSTLLRWDDLTRNADLIRAKHVLFLMDACYGGLAVTRSSRPGAMRFLRDMMQRVSRQVLTAGKANELVADLGGPLPDHSVFTGHLIEALNGKAEDNEGNLTANGVTAYVYQKVSSDATSQQTPHYGYLHGDGDMIFYPVPSTEQQESQVPQEDHLVSVPAISTGEDEQLEQQQKLKELLSEPKYRIQLHDFMAQKTRELLSLTGDDYFSVSGSVSNEIFVERLHKYEEAIQSILKDEMLLARWAQPEHMEDVRMPLKKLAQRIGPMGGMTYLIESRWYPAFLLLYGGCIGALAGKNYEAVYTLLHTQVPNPYGRANGDVLLSAVIKAMSDIHEGFKLLPGHERQHTPRSEYIFKLLQPVADDLLFLGNEYEEVFDRTEIFIALEYIHLNNPAAIAEGERTWAPIGRFGWKYESPLAKLITEVNGLGEKWPPLSCGLFGGSKARFMELAGGLSHFTSRLAWY